MLFLLVCFSCSKAKPALPTESALPPAEETLFREEKAASPTPIASAPAAVAPRQASAQQSAARSAGGEALYQISIQATEGGKASFRDEQPAPGLPYVAVARPNEGYFFDHWELLSGKTDDELTAPVLSVFEADTGVRVKAVFKRDLGTLFVSAHANAASSPKGTRDAPYRRLSEAVSEARLRIESGKTATVQIRLASGVYPLYRQEMLELVPGISLTGGYDSQLWNKTDDLLPEDPALLSVIQLTPSFVAESMFSVTPVGGMAAISGRVEKPGSRPVSANAVTLSALVLDGFSMPAVLLSAHGVSVSVQGCRLEGYGKALLSAFDCGFSLTDSELHAYGSRSTALSVEPVSKPGVYVANNQIRLGKAHRPLLQGVGIQIYSPESLAYNRVQLLNNDISAYVTENFTGIKVDNGSMICNNNRIESFNEMSGSGFGMDLKGAAMVNKNWISIGSNDGWGLSLKSDGASGRILNNTILTHSVNQNGKLTACGPIEGKDLMIAYNVFVNPAQSDAAALGVAILTEGHTVANNRLISNNADEKQFLIGLNGNVDSLPENLRTVSETAQEVPLQY